MLLPAGRFEDADTTLSALESVEFRGHPGKAPVTVPPTPDQIRVPLSELLGALSFALDLTEGQPKGHAARACLIGMRIARELRLTADDQSDLYYALLLKDTGCSSNSAETAAFFGSDDQPLKRALKTVDWSRRMRAMTYALRHAAVGRGLRARVAQLGRMRSTADEVTSRLFRVRCERGAEIVAKMGFPDATSEAVRTLDEHWDGSGEPNGISGHEIPLFARIAQLSQTLEVFAGDVGWSRAVDVVRDRSGRWFDPELVAVLDRADDPTWWQSIQGEGLLAHLPIVEPDDRIRTVDAAGVNRIAEGFAEVVDAKSPFTFRHSARVAHIAHEIGHMLGMWPPELEALYRAGLLHDIGKLGVSNRILDKPGPLTADERDAVETHPRHTWSILSQVGLFRSIARTASVHHERLDGKGYPWGIAGSGLGEADRVLAVADTYDALTSDRPYRMASTHDAAMDIMGNLRDNALDGRMMDALDSAAREGQIRAAEAVRPRSS